MNDKRISSVHGDSISYLLEALNVLPETLLIVEYSLDVRLMLPDGVLVLQQYCIYVRGNSTYHGEGGQEYRVPSEGPSSMRARAPQSYSVTQRASSYSPRPPAPARSLHNIQHTVHNVEVNQRATLHPNTCITVAFNKPFCHFLTCSSE